MNFIELINNDMLQSSMKSLSHSVVIWWPDGVATTTLSEAVHGPVHISLTALGTIKTRRKKKK